MITPHTIENHYNELKEEVDNLKLENSILNVYNEKKTIELGVDDEDKKNKKSKKRRDKKKRKRNRRKRKKKEETKIN